MKKNLSLAARIGLGFAAIVSLLILITAIGIQRVWFIDATLEEVSENAAKVQRYAIDLAVCTTGLSPFVTPSW